MPAPVFVGDELTAAGFRLAGARVCAPAPAEAPAVFERARAEADLVLLGAGLARTLPEARLREALRAPRPLVVIVPEARGEVPAPDLETWLRRVLGLEA